MTRFPAPDRQRPGDAQRNAATCLAMFGLVAMGLALIGFTALVLPQIRGLLLVVAGIAAFILLHYVTWGYWLSNQPRTDDEEREP
jgi:hypothetical protein